MLWRILLIIISIIITYISSTCGNSPIIPSRFRNRLRQKQNRQIKSSWKPYLADIERVDIDNKMIKKHICNGAIINEKFVLTSGSCIDKLDINEIGIRVGSRRAQVGGIIKVVSKKIMHPWFYETKHAPVTHDLALLKMNRSLGWTDDVLPIPKLADGDTPIPGTSITILGWDPDHGMVYEDNYSDENDVLDIKSLAGVVMSNDECQKEYDKVVEIKSWMICIKYSSVTSESCFESQGAPLVHNNILYGIRMPRIPGADCSKPDIFMLIKNTRVWINYVSKHV
ncbi:trypsin 5G1-like [Chrysoperla carnea]|uniref:trypsin 5G1-like n=1 Tax=Chrysoperla carnea TaxID=189513 RepID=UPI001D093375|nr:trypsin 5G1-like [Chrysoperla carnea]